MEEEIDLINNKKIPQPSAPILTKNDSMTTAQINETHGFKNNSEKGILKSNLKGNKFNKEESQKKALENLDEMVKSIYDTDIPGMCYLPPPPPNSKSEGNIGYLQGAYR
jgi:guanylate cyclase